MTKYEKDIFAIVNTSCEHLTVEQIFQRLKERHPKVVLATVYNNLNKLLEEELIRKVSIDWKLAMQLNRVTQDFPENQPLFVQKRVFNSTINNLLQRYCEELDIPVISVHGLRHTHASLLLFAGVSIASVAKRLGHADMTTTQQTYLHIIQELENKDNSKIMQHLASL